MLSPQPQNRVSHAQVSTAFLPQLFCLSLPSLSAPAFVSPVLSLPSLFVFVFVSSSVSQSPSLFVFVSSSIVYSVFVFVCVSSSVSVSSSIVYSVVAQTETLLSQSTFLYYIFVTAYIFCHSLRFCLGTIIGPNSSAICWGQGQ